ncbi:MAG: J domain-containing protein [Myxococcota bacterium]|nr:J domain-containing protein [Myxococcota bacterium]
MSDLSELEIDALAKIAGELSYYQLLQVEPDVSGGDLKKAYYSLSRSYHPDANRNLPEKAREGCHRISKVLTEAYCVLRDPRKRKAYDAQLEETGDLRIQLAEAAASHAKSESVRRTGSTPQSKQFLLKAEEDVRNGNLPSAVQNLQMALTFEPGNTGFNEMLEELRKRQQADK